MLPPKVNANHSFAKYGFETINDVIGHIAMCYYCYGGREEDGIKFETMQDAVDGFQAL